MRDLIRHKAFVISFLISYFGFFFLTIFVLGIKQPQIGAGNVGYGYPFVHYYSVCFGSYYSYSGLLGNILFAAILGTILGLIFSYLWKNLTLRIKLKSYPRKSRKKDH